jgi:hypothetical protein
LAPGEVRSSLAVQNEEGETTGWVEAKRGANEMEETIELATPENSQQNGARHREYPATRSRPRPTVEDTEDEADESAPELTIPNEDPVVIEDYSGLAVTNEQAKKRKRTPTKEGTAQAGRKVPVKLRAEAEPEKMVDKILNQSVEGITVREVLGLSPDLLRGLWGVKRLPALKGTILATRAEEANPAHEKHVRFVTRVEAIGKQLYAYASPTVMGKLEGTRRVKLLIDSGSEMCVMSRRLWR